MTDPTNPSQPLSLRKEELNWRAVGDELVILDLRGGTYLSVNSSGMLLWNLIAESPRTREELTEQLIAAYDVSPQIASEDVHAFVTLLSENDFLA